MTNLFQTRPRWRLSLSSKAILALVGLLTLSGCAPQFFEATSWSGVSSASDSATVYYGSKFGGVIALDPETRQKAWSLPAEDKPPPVYSTPLFHEGLLYFGDFKGNVYAVTPSGQVEWKRSMPGHIFGDAAFSSGRVFFSSSTGAVHAYDAASGNELWTFTAKKGVWSTPASSNGTLYVTSMDGNLYALDIASGLEQWRFATGGPIAGSPIVEGERVYVGSFDSTLYAVNVQTRQADWSFRGENWFWTRPVIADDTLYAGGLDHNLYAIDVETGQLLPGWPFSTQGAIRSAPAILGDTVVVGSEEGKVYAVRQNGVKAWEQEIGSPVYAPVLPFGDVLLTVGEDGTVYALDATTGTQRWSFDSQKEAG